MLRKLRRKRVDKEWANLGFIEVKPGSYMRRRDFTAKQIRALEDRKARGWRNRPRRAA